MRYPACKKTGDNPARRAIPFADAPHVEKFGIRRATFYCWYDLYHTGGPEALGDRSPRPDRVWNRIPDVVRKQSIMLALGEPTLSPRELAVRFTDTENYFVSGLPSSRQPGFYRHAPLLRPDL